MNAWSSLFEIDFRTRERCTVCPNVTLPYNDRNLNVNIPTHTGGGTSSVASLFEQGFGHLETVVENRRCHSCGEDEGRYQKSQIKNPPHTLLLTMHRTHANGSKNNRRQNLARDEKLDVEKYLVQDRQDHQGVIRYRLAAIVMHSGTLHEGHYTTLFTRRRSGRDWFKADDDSVRRLTDLDDDLKPHRMTRTTPTPFILCYVLDNAQTTWPPTGQRQAAPTPDIVTTSSTMCVKTPVRRRGLIDKADVLNTPGLIQVKMTPNSSCAPPTAAQRPALTSSPNTVRQAPLRKGLLTSASGLSGIPAPNLNISDANLTPPGNQQIPLPADFDDNLLPPGNQQIASPVGDDSSQSSAPDDAPVTHDRCRRAIEDLDQLRNWDVSRFLTHTRRASADWLSVAALSGRLFNNLGGITLGQVFDATREAAYQQAARTDSNGSENSLRSSGTNNSNLTPASDPFNATSSPLVSSTSAPFASTSENPPPSPGSDPSWIAPLPPLPNFGGPTSSDVARIEDSASNANASHHSSSSSEFPTASRLAALNPPSATMGRSQAPDRTVGEKHGRSSDDQDGEDEDPNPTSAQRPRI